MLPQWFNWIWPWTRQARNQPAAHLDLGQRGESIAARFLRRQGYKILVTGFRSKSGEIDIVARHKEWLVFVEVKTRASEEFGPPADAVDKKKQQHMTKVALDYLRLLKYPDVRFRFDIVEIILPHDAQEPSDVRLIQDAFEMAEPYMY
jgi:putative endonuclease